MSKNDDFYDLESQERTFTRNGKSKTFRIRELSGDEAEKLFDIRRPDGKTDQAKLKGLDSRILHTCVTEVDGETETAISLELAGKLPARFRRELVQVAMDVNGLSDKSSEAVAGD